MKHMQPLLWAILAASLACARPTVPTPVAPQCPSREQVCEIAFGSEAKKTAADSTKPAPTSWRPFPGANTDQSSIDWLYRFAAAGSNTSEGICGVVGCFVDFLGSNRSAIVARCRNEPTDDKKILCAAREVRAVLQQDSTNVCRNYAIAMWWVLSDLGLESDLECAPTHAWVETEFNGKRVLIDAYNDIYIIVD